MTTLRLVRDTEKPILPPPETFEEEITDVIPASRKELHLLQRAVIKNRTQLRGLRVVLLLTGIGWLCFLLT